jgi:hypothetical protein
MERWSVQDLMSVKRNCGEEAFWLREIQRGRWRVLLRRGPRIENECDSVLTEETREGGDGQGEIACRRDGRAGPED